MKTAIDLIKMYWPNYPVHDIPLFDEAITIPAWDDTDDVICHVGLMDRMIKVDGENRIVGGIGFVCTREDYRHMGLMHSAMNMAHMRCEARQVPFTLLNTGLNGLYESMGYRRTENLPWPWMVRETFLPGVLPWPESAVIDLQGTW